MIREQVRLSHHTYPVFIGSDLLHYSHLEPYLLDGPLHIVTDPTVASLYLDTVERALHPREARVHIMPSGDHSKTLETFSHLAEAILISGLDRHGQIIALGGGVVGDMVGFLSATLLRGVQSLQIPTTLLAQIDGAFGGKAGVNTSQGKNLIGAFHHPAAVFSDVRVFSTLPRRQMRAGYGELVKYAVLSGEPFFSWLETHGQEVLAGSPDALMKAISHSVAFKVRAVEADEKDTKQRALLNLGHTFGHALESATDFSNLLLHGEAVAMGIIMALQLSVQQGLCEEAVFQRVYTLVEKAGLLTCPQELPFAWDSHDFLRRMKSFDKKSYGGKLHLILARGLGRVFAQAFVPDDVVEEFIAGWIKRS